MAETVQASQQDGHFNESIVNEEILEDMKKNRIDHMKYLPDMEQLEESDVMDQVISAMNAYDYDKYTEADVRRALAHDNRTPEDFQALLSPAALLILFCGMHQMFCSIETFFRFRDHCQFIPCLGIDLNQAADRRTINIQCLADRDILFSQSYAITGYCPHLFSSFLQI